jgi:hypothetical protein
MRPVVKVAWITAGYAAAFAIASAVEAVRIANTSGPEAQASSGMYAFGDSVLFVAVFGLLALVPTAAAFYVLRSDRRFWLVLSGIAFALALTGVTSALLFAIGRHAEPASSLAFWGALSVLRILIAPLFTLFFLLAALLSPFRGPRMLLLVGAAMDATVSAYGALTWFVPMIAGR